MIAEKYIRYGSFLIILNIKELKIRGKDITQSGDKSVRIRTSEIRPIEK